MSTRWKQAVAWVPAAVLIAALAALSAFDVFEQDVFWQIRAGDEIVRGLGLQHVDTWSLTARGREFINWEWLSTVLLRTVYGAGGVTALIGLRVVLAVALLTFAALLIRRHVASARAPLAMLLLLPLFYVTIAFKIEVRSDTFVFIVFATAQRLWAGAMRDRTKLLTSVALTILAANLHVGTAPFVAVAALPAIWALDMSTPRRLGWSAAQVLALLVNPYGWRILPILWEHIAYGHYNKLDNFDHAPLSFSQFSLLNFGIAAWTWVPLAVAGWVGFALAARGEWKKHRAATLIAAGVGALFTFIAATRMRAFPYHLFYFLPFIAALVDRGLVAVRVGEGKRRRLGPKLAWLAAAAASAWLVTQQVRFYSVTYRGEIARNAFPVGSAAFIRKAGLRPNLFHTYGFGGYFVWALRDYLTFVDTRETMFRHVQGVMLNAQRSPEYAHRLWDAFDINVAVIPTPQSRYIPEVAGFEDAIAPLFPYEQWAIVYYDDISTVVVRRIPAHEAIIRANEYVLLRPQIPANHYLTSKSRTPENDVKFMAELSRCLQNEPDNVHCVIADSAMLRLWSGASSLQPARDRMIALRQKGARNLSFLVEFAAVLRATGDSERAQTVDAQITSLTYDR